MVLRPRARFARAWSSAIKLCSITNLISQKFSDSAVILAAKTRQFWIRKARVLDFCVPTIRPFQKHFFKDYFFTALVDFGELFSIIKTSFLSFSKFLGFRKALEQDIMFSSVGVVSRLENSKHLWDLIFLDNNFIRNVFSYANFQRSQKCHCYQLHWDTLFQKLIKKTDFKPDKTLLLVYQTLLH